MATLLAGTTRVDGTKAGSTQTDALMLRDVDGDALPLDPARWHGSITALEHQLLAMVDGPVLDIGCGPGRIIEQLARRGVVALGVDPAAGAVSLARRRGCSALQRSVFDPLPKEGRWQTVLLLDGNIGIGGDPVRLLCRCHELVHQTGSVIAEVEPPGTGVRTCRARLERGHQSGAWFSWSIVGADAIASLGGDAGLFVGAIDHIADNRWFAHLMPLGGRRHGSR